MVTWISSGKELNIFSHEYNEFYYSILIHILVYFLSVSLSLSVSLCLFHTHTHTHSHTHTHTHTHTHIYIYIYISRKSDLTDKIKRSFFQAPVVSILLYGCTTWTLTKRMEKSLDSNYTRMLRVILNKSWRQHPTKQQLYGHLPTITKTIKVRRTRHAGHCWRSRDELIMSTCQKRWTIGRSGKR